MTPRTGNKKKGNLIILSGPSGVGKTTLRKALQARMPGLRFSVSWTTRLKRAGETSGRDYQYVSREQFEEQIHSGGFLEWARVHDASYGTPWLPIKHWLGKGADVLLDIDTQGARQVKKQVPQALTVFILPPSPKALAQRLRQRRTESLTKLRLRLKNAEKELKEIRYFEYAVVNRDLDEAVKALETIITAARYRINRK
ncbi:MAG: guanylate kinase [Thermodesulfobacteriota bacterium]